MASALTNLFEKLLPAEGRATVVFDSSFDSAQRHSVLAVLQEHHARIFEEKLPERTLGVGQQWQFRHEASGAITGKLESWRFSIRAQNFEEFMVNLRRQCRTPNDWVEPRPAPVRESHSVYSMLSFRFPRLRMGRLIARRSVVSPESRA